MTKAFVTGGAGFVGSHLVDLLLDRGYRVTCLVRKTDDLRWLEDTGVRIVYGDCTDRESLERALEPDTAYVFHLAAVLHAERPELYEAVNVQGTRNLVEACRRKTPTLRRLVYTSSAVAAGPSGRHSACREEDPCSPVNQYGRSKLKAEALLRRAVDIPSTILRPALVYGPRNYHGVYSYFHVARKGFRMYLGRGASTVVYVKDLAEALLLAAEREEAAGRTYFVGEGRPYSYRQMTDIISGANGKRGLPLFVPWIAVLAAGVLLEAFSRVTPRARVFTVRRARDLRHRYWVYDTSRIHRELGFAPRYTLVLGVRETMQWYDREGWI